MSRRGPSNRSVRECSWSAVAGELPARAAPAVGHDVHGQPRARRRSGTGRAAGRAAAARPPGTRGRSAAAPRGRATRRRRRRGTTTPARACPSPADPWRSPPHRAPRSARRRPAPAPQGGVRRGRRPVATHAACRGISRALCSAHSSLRYVMACPGRGRSPGATARRTNSSTSACGHHGARGQCASARGAAQPARQVGRDDVGRDVAAAPAARPTTGPARRWRPAACASTVPVELPARRAAAARRRRPSAADAATLSSIPCATTCRSVSSRESTCTGRSRSSAGSARCPELRVGPVMERAVQHVPVHVDDRARRIVEAQAVQLVVDAGRRRIGRQRGLASARRRAAGRRPRAARARGTTTSRSSIGRSWIGPAGVRQDRRALGEHHGDARVGERAQRGGAARHEQLGAQPGEAHDPVDLGGDGIVGAGGQPRGDQRQDAVLGGPEILDRALREPVRGRAIGVRARRRPRRAAAAPAPAVQASAVTTAASRRATAARAAARYPACSCSRRSERLSPWIRRRRTTSSCSWKRRPSARQRGPSRRPRHR